MTRRACAAVLACSLALAAVGCGSSDSSSGAEQGPNPNDERAVALQCVTEEKGLPAALVGEQSIQVQGPDGPRIEFFVSSGEAEGLQFDGEAQGAEQLGSALLFVGNASDELLAELEDCLM